MFTDIRVVNQSTGDDHLVSCMCAAFVFPEMPFPGHFLAL
jgi:hypothetical protein